MYLIRSDKGRIKITDGSKIEILKFGYSSPIYVDQCKYVDVDHQAVFIVDRSGVYPTRATRSKLDKELISVIINGMLSEPVYAV